MGRVMEFDYYYGIEAEQFSFYRVPRLLIKDERFKGLSSDAKLLYGLMLDRMALSMKNGWCDEENRAYIIYAVENMAEDLGCSKPTCTKIMKELDADTGIGLIEKRRRGQGKTDIIYVKNFAAMTEREMEDIHGSTDVSVEIKDFNLKKQKNLTSRNKRIELPEVKSFAPNYNKINYNDQNYMEMSYINPINQPEEILNEQPEQEGGDKIDVVEGVNAYMELIRNNIEYEHHMQYDSQNDKEIYEEIYKIICDVVCVKRKTVRINGGNYPYELVKSCFLKLDGSHVEYVMDCMRETATKITNIRAYLMTALYNAPSTMNNCYRQEVRHDMYGGGWEEKEVIGNG